VYRKLEKIKLLLNTLSRLSLIQIFFLLHNKIIKHKLKPILLVFNKINNRLNNFIAFETITDDINQLVGSNSIWQAGVEQTQKHYRYYNELKANIITYTNSGDITVFVSYWNNLVSDVEVNYNYQRFYLFKEVFDELDVSDDIKIQLMLKWINKSNNVHLTWTGFNCALRLINWLKILKDISPDNLSEDSWKVIQQSIYLQNKFNVSNIEHHIPGNHIIFQYYSAWLISEIFSVWETKTGSKSLLEKLLAEIDSEFLDSGLHFELSSHYHLQSSLVGLYLIGHLRNLGRKVPEELTSTINKAAVLINNFMIGDYYPLTSDGCYNFFHENYSEDVQSFYYLKDRFLKREEMNPIINYNHQYILTKNNNFNIIFDVGEIGLKQNPGHGHADILSIILGSHNIPIFIDPGTLQYNNKIESLSLKMTSNHNTVAINGENQAKLWGFFRWSYLPKDIISSYKINDDGSIYAEGKFLGYPYLGGIRHTRTLKIMDDSVVINDLLNGKLDYDIQVNFILHPSINIVKHDNNRIILSSGLYTYVLSSNTDKMNPIVQDIKIYVSYNEPVSSKKIIFEKRKIKGDTFRSEIILKQIS
jgi:uncharacterized heparinase superfamily protein